MLWYEILDDLRADYVFDVSPIWPLKTDIGTGLLCRLLCSDEQAMNLGKIDSRQHCS